MSFVAEHLVADLRKILPPDARPDLDAYEQRAQALGGDRRSEFRRAQVCARWAVDVVAEPQHSGLVGVAASAVEALKEVGEAAWAEMGADVDAVVARLFPGRTGAAVLGTWVGVEGVEQAPGTGASPLVGPEIAWVLEAVAVAERVAQSDGWAAVPWRRLIEDVLSR